MENESTKETIEYRSEDGTIFKYSSALTGLVEVQHKGRTSIYPTISDLIEFVASIDATRQEAPKIDLQEKLEQANVVYDKRLKEQAAARSAEDKEKQQSN